jgi:archaellum biogenesis ATPase FlaH
MYNGQPLEKMEADDSNQMVYLPSKGKLMTKGELRLKESNDRAMELTDSIKVVDVSSKYPTRLKPKTHFNEIKIEKIEIKAEPRKLNTFWNLEESVPVRFLADENRWEMVEWPLKKLYYEFESKTPKLKIDDCPICELEAKGIPVSKRAHVEKHLGLDALNQAYDDYLDSFVDKEELHDSLDGVDTTDMAASEVAKLDADVKYARQSIGRVLRKVAVGRDDNSMLVTGNPSFDNALGGFPIGQLSVLIGRVGAGRTATSESLSVELAKNNLVMHYSFESDFEEMIRQHKRSWDQGLVRGKLYAIDMVCNSDVFLQDLEDELEGTMDASYYNLQKVVVIDDFSAMCPRDFAERQKFIRRLSTLAHSYNATIIAAAQAVRQAKGEDAIWNQLDYVMAATAGKIIQLTKLDGVSIVELKIVKDRYYNNTSNKAYFHLQARRFLNL